MDGSLRVWRRRWLPPELVLFEDVTGCWLSSLVGLASHLRLPEHFDQGALRVEELAARLDLPSAELERFLAILAAQGYLEQVPARPASYRLTALGRALSSGVGGAFAELQTSEWYRVAFGHQAVLRGWRQGQAPWEGAMGQPFFEYLEKEPKPQAVFATAMTEITRFCLPYLLCEITVNEGDRVLDVGGGEGELGRALAERFPAIEVTVFDRASGVDRPSRTAPPNYRFLRGDFFAGIPSGHNHVVLKSILHDWDDDVCHRLLSHCRAGVPEAGRLTLIECLLPEEPSALEAPSYMLDWNVWLMLRGRERTERQYRELLAAAGWRLERVRPTPTPYRLLEAVPIPC